MDTGEHMNELLMECFVTGIIQMKTCFSQH